MESQKEKKKYSYSKEKRQEYNKTFYETHQEPIQCPDCGLYYKYHNKYNHIKTRLHLLALKIKSQKQEVMKEV